MGKNGERSNDLGPGDLNQGIESLQEGVSLRGPLAPLDAHGHSNHLALIYESRDEQFAAVVPFVRQGLQRGERCLYVADENSPEEILRVLRDAGIDVGAALESGALEVTTVQETYLQDGAFDVDDSVELLETAIAEGTADFEGLRIAVEESWILRERSVTEDFVALEAQVNEIFRDEDFVALCQYDRKRFPPDVIHDVIRTHPHIIHGHTVADNVYYTPPEEFFGGEHPATEVDRKLGRLQDRTEVTQNHRRVVEALEAAEEGISLLDDDGNFSYVNDAYAKTFGYEPEAMIGEHWDTLGIEADPDFIYEEVLPTIDRDGQWNGTTTCVRDDGSTFLAQHSLTQTKDDELICVVRDVTEQRERETDLELFRNLIEQSNDGVFVIDPEDGRLLDVNDTACQRLGFDRGELLSLSVSDIDTELPNPEDWRAFVDRLEDEGAVNFDGIHRRKDGSTFPVDVNVTFVELDQAYVLSIARDVSDRRKREHELQRALDLLERTERIADVGGWEIDPETRDVFWSGHLFELLEVNGGEEPPIEEVLDMYHEEDRHVIEGAVETALATGDSFDVEARIHTENGDVRWLRLQGVPETVDGEIVSLRGAAQDVTERKRRERRLEELVEQLEESNERLEQFAYAASHDLQEPLRMVSSYLQLLERRYGDDLGADGQKFLKFAVDGADRMREMIQGLLQYSRVEMQGDPIEPVELDRVFEDVLSDLQFQIRESGADITAEDLPRVEGDSSQLRQVFQNLLENAITYSGEEPPRIHVSTERDGEEWVVSVHDEGIGIDATDADRIFQVFERLHSHEEHSGTGIGLALCERIVERHGGRIWVDSTPGDGSTFSLALPRARPEQ